MLKKIFIFVLTLLLAVSFIAPGYCGSPMEKLGRGACNLVTWPLELFHRMNEANKRGGVEEAATYGLLEGLWMMTLRAAVGFWEVVTFPVALPENYGPVLTDPEFFIRFPQKK